MVCTPSGPVSFPPSCLDAVKDLEELRFSGRGGGSDSTPGFYHNHDLPVAGEVTYSEALGASWTLSP